MNRRTLIASIGAVVGTSTAAAAYTSATIDRSATIDVVADQNGLIGLNASADSNYIMNDGSDALTIDLTAEGAGGANAEAVYEFGDPANADTTYAFQITNNDANERNIDLTYNIGTNPGSGDGKDYLEFTIYNSGDGSGVATDADGNVTSVVTENATYQLTAAAGTTYNVVLTVDTVGLSSADDLSGTLEVRA